MTILRHSDYFTDVLTVLRDSGPMHRRALGDRIASMHGLSEAERARVNPKGTNIFRSRIHWSSSVLVLAGLLERPARGELGITSLGEKLLAEHPEGISEQLVKAQPAFRETQERMKENRQKRKAEQGDAVDDLQSLSSLDQTPLELLEQAISELEAGIATDLVSRIQSLPPQALEILLLRLMRAMGYGTSEALAVHLGQSGDEGLDGVIYQDQLGFHRIYLQAKRYRTGNNISGEQMNAFIGAIERKSGIGGVFVTTSDFYEGARKAAAETSKHIALINGFELGQLLIEYEIGVRFPKTYREVEVDDSYFEELLDS